jgi:hypothetical protein
MGGFGCTHRSLLLKHDKRLSHFFYITLSFIIRLLGGGAFIMISNVGSIMVSNVEVFELKS